MAEARRAAENVVARRRGRAPQPFVYRDRGVALAVGRRRGAASLRHVALWGRPASWLKRMVEREYANSLERGAPTALL
jgi:NADH dehydrogenase FAD-containing subunit